MVVRTGDDGVRSILTTWSAIAALTICPFFCLGDACAELSGAEETPTAHCSPHCCGSETPARDHERDQRDPCDSDCLCKGALPVKPSLELPPPIVTDMLPVESHLIGIGGFGNPVRNVCGPPRSPNDEGRGLRIALCSFLC